MAVLDKEFIHGPFRASPSAALIFARRSTATTSDARWAHVCLASNRVRARRAIARRSPAAAAASLMLVLFREWRRSLATNSPTSENMSACSPSTIRSGAYAAGSR